MIFNTMPTTFWVLWDFNYSVLYRLCRYVENVEKRYWSDFDSAALIGWDMTRLEHDTTDVLVHREQFHSNGNLRSAILARDVFMNTNLSVIIAFDEKASIYTLMTMEWETIMV